ncbi:MAG: Zn-ribbon domain-containing OB-fold protein [Candidatus Bathyarchaeota archaeon]|nr:Zn-ribbon domain-containing OB-fold protein [Candidatus Bathyarchaeota archaeon]MDH5623899.1 Zn-ribbon domain-containing OB-fold protein [Candidatus Bathyarchaeota archaeon]MDH5636255.1 Zn-ribbon domain-containing OB-fold protein [Candidatus Bathyarchaeota archaeon]MDH5702411.1 Zn-ribbon domain-containing OB-fold protein [Candidatus Bathyarchaeota archaeon]
MSETLSFTIESFYKFVSEGKLMAAKCRKCGTLLLPPRPVCTKCLSTDFRWVELKGKGKLLSYTVIHVSPMQFESMAPYTVGIVELEAGPHLPGMIRDVEPEKIRVGMDLVVDFDTSVPTQWPLWPRYFFRLP